MAGRIEVQAIGGANSNAREPRVLNLLPGAIAGVETKYYLQARATHYCPVRQPHRGQALLFVRGEGEVRAGAEVFSVSEVAAFCPMGADPIGVTATSQVLEYLEILIDLQAHETVRVLPRPYFIRYAQCEPYAEAIKSPKTISRTIVPANILPRFSMGSVETTGPDTVGAHSHPMLEQLFFGLADNRCIVTADGSEAVLEERMLLHVPHGSRHGVRVEDGSRLHYVWMDFFRDTAGLAYLQEQHKPTFPALMR